MHQPKLVQRLVLAVFLLSSGCGNAPDVQVNEISVDAVSYDETVHINNCGGKADSEQTVERSFTTSIEGAAGFRVGSYRVVEGSVSAKYGQYRNVVKSQKLTAPPGTNMEFVLKWSDEVHAGNVTVDGQVGTYNVRVPIAVEQVSSRDLGCNAATQTTVPPAVVQGNLRATFYGQDGEGYAGRLCTAGTTNDNVHIRLDGLRVDTEPISYRVDDYAKGGVWATPCNPVSNWLLYVSVSSPGQADLYFKPFREAPDGTEYTISVGYDDGTTQIVKVTGTHVRP